jgi:ribonuclease HI
MGKKYYYAVKKGFVVGIYTTWKEAELQIRGYPKPSFRKFENLEDAREYMNPTKDVAVSKSDLMTGIFATDCLSKCDTVPSEWNVNDGEYYIFTDGSGLNGLTRYGVYFGKNALNISVTVPNSTNNRCEFLGIKVALELIVKNKKSLNKETVCIISDSEYCIKSITEWMENWIKRDWKKANGSPVLNSDILKEIDFLLIKIKMHNVEVKFTHCNSHTSPPLANDYQMFIWQGNQIADYLAKNQLSTTTQDPTNISLSSK